MNLASKSETFEQMSWSGSADSRALWHRYISSISQGYSHMLLWFHSALSDQLRRYEQSQRYNHSGLNDLQFDVFYLLFSSPQTGYLILIAAMLVARTYCDVWMIQNGTMIERSESEFYLKISHSIHDLINDGLLMWLREESIWIMYFSQSAHVCSVFFCLNACYYLSDQSSVILSILTLSGFRANHRTHLEKDEVKSCVSLIFDHRGNDRATIYWLELSDKQASHLSTAVLLSVWNQSAISLKSAV